MRLAFVLLVCAGSALAQPAVPTFEVASVKPSPADVPGTFIRPLPGGGLSVTGATLKFLISAAYGVRGFQITGAPDWAGAERFDIEGRGDGGAAMPTDPAVQSETQRKAYERLRGLLAERFQLTFHRETREQPVYNLVAAKGGPKMTGSGDDRGGIRGGRGFIRGQSTTLAMLTLNLANQLERSVVDRTGLTGRYTFELTWTASGGDSGPSIFTALMEQLGLRLESARGPVEMLVIDGVQRPSAN